MFDHILVPTDGSDPAEAAVEAAIAFAERFDATLHAVHVLEIGGLRPGFEDEAATELDRRGKWATRAVAERAADRGIDVTTAMLDSGKPTHQAILSYADDCGADCIVMGTYGRTGIDRLIVGSVAERTLRESPIPVVTVHEETAVDPDFGTILVPTDGSEPAEVAADLAIELALATGAALAVVHVTDLGAIASETDVSAVLDALETSGERMTERVVERARSAGVSTVGATVLNGTPHRSIVDYADDCDADCIVMGSHGRQGLDRYLLGSVTERVVRTADVPVLATKGPDESPGRSKSET